MRDEKTIVIASYELENKSGMVGDYWLNLTFYFILGESFKPPGMESTSPEIPNELLCK